METLTEKLGEVLSKLGQAFLIAGYLPAVLFVLAHQFFLFPRLMGRSITIFQLPGPSEGAGTASQWVYLVDQGVTLLLLPMLIGVLLMSLNTLIIKFYEGALGWQRWFLLLPLQRRNQRLAKALYGELLRLKEAYTRTLAELAASPDEARRAQLEQQRASLALEIQRLHEELSHRAPVQRLPRRPEMVKPTALGNAFAVIEEYPYERYGMDGMLFWPRLRPLVDEQYASVLVNTKMVLDLLLNLSLLALVFGLEAVFASVKGGLDLTVMGAGLAAWCLSYVCYRGAVTTVYSLGDTIALCFDFFRGRLLEKFGLSQPTSLEEEQAMWLRLGQFLRYGEGFYFPTRQSPEGSGSERESQISTK